MWEDESETKWVECKWYYRPGDIPSTTVGWCHAKEIFESDHLDDNHPETIIAKATVLSERDFENLNPADQNLPYVYLCRRAYNRHHKILAPLSDDIQTSEPVSLQIAEPSVFPEENLPDTSELGVFGAALSQLHLSVVPKILPCRESERDDVYTTIRACVESNLGSVMYISGQPGTGKTATVHEVVRCLKDEVAKKKLSDFDYLEVNALRLPSPHRAYSVIYEGLMGAHHAPNVAATKLDDMFSRPAKKRKFCVVLIDELDHMVTPQQTVLYNILDWPTRKHSRLLIIGIANTMDLPERLLPRVCSRLGLKRIVFHAYTHDQIQTIIHSRLNALKAFQPKSIELIARRVAHVSGDIRRALQVCRRAIEVAMERGVELVDRHIVDEAIKSLSETSVVQALKSLAIHQIVFACCVMMAASSHKTPSVPFEQICAQHSSLCSKGNLSVPTRVDFVDICNRLADMGVIESKTCESTAAHLVELSIDAADLKLCILNIDWLNNAVADRSRA
eukprot:c19429_g1_i2.p1 GENE.c19429_g1_i2~~c19429_g1_i2.p1  ORF type:complete len:582 (+),score=135.04 c19429_g1_i2:230-1747(+)